MPAGLGSKQGAYAPRSPWYREKIVASGERELPVSLRPNREVIGVPFLSPNLCYYSVRGNDLCTAKSQ
jgi:hypothetical protein